MVQRDANRISKGERDQVLLPSLNTTLLRLYGKPLLPEETDFTELNKVRSFTSSDIDLGTNSRARFNVINRDILKQGDIPESDFKQGLTFEPTSGFTSGSTSGSTPKSVPVPPLRPKITEEKSKTRAQEPSLPTLPSLPSLAFEKKMSQKETDQPSSLVPSAVPSGAMTPSRPPTTIPTSGPPRIIINIPSKNVQAPSLPALFPLEKEKEREKEREKGKEKEKGKETIIEKEQREKRIETGRKRIIPPILTPELAQTIELPKTPTIISPRKIRETPRIVKETQSVLPSASQKYLEVAKEIDVDRLNATGRGTSYRVTELQDFLSRLGLNRKGNKQQLVNNIKEALRKLGIQHKGL